MIKLNTVVDEIEDELNRLIKGPTAKDLLEFETTLATQFQATQAAVHVITGSLKLSGKVASEFSGGTWEGEIVYGGPSSGVNNPVEYAQEESSKGGPHDFMAPLKGLSSGYISAMNSFLGG